MGISSKYLITAGVALAAVAFVAYFQRNVRAVPLVGEYLPGYTPSA